MEPKQTYIKGTFEVGDKEHKLAFYDGVNYNLTPEESRKERFQKIKRYVTAIERRIVSDLGMDLDAYMRWRDEG